MWKKKTGQQIDGAMAIDPTALSYLMTVTGTVRAPDGTRINAHNVVTLTQSDIYARYPTLAEQPQRKAFLIGLSQAVDDAILHSKDTKGLLRQFGVAEGQRRLLFWSADPAIESILAQTVGGGVIPETTVPYIGPVVTSRTGNKLDFYLEQTINVAGRHAAAPTESPSP